VARLARAFLPVTTVDTENQLRCCYEDTEIQLKMQPQRSEHISRPEPSEPQVSVGLALQELFLNLKFDHTKAGRIMRESYILIKHQSNCKPGED
jgi:hypothetical protein